MKIVVFGAAGGAGQLILLQALARGHEVTAVVRSASSFKLSYPNLKVVEADALKPRTYAAAFQGQDAVISALGVSGLRRSLKPMTFHTDSARLILAEMQKQEIKRYIGMSSVGVLEKSSTPLWYRIFPKPLLRHKYRDMREMEQLVEAQPLNWTVVRPVQLVCGPLSERYRVSISGDLPKGGRISRNDVASFIVKSINDPQTFARKIAISY